MAATTALAPFDFQPPRAYAFEPELQGPTPRAIPPALRQGPYARRRMDTIRASVIFGAGALLLDWVPGIDRLGLYLLPLAHLFWIGLAALAFAGLCWLDFRVRLGPFRYVRDGAPLVVRIMDLAKGPSVILNGQATHYAFTAAVGFVHPETAQPCGFQLKSDDFPSARRGDIDTPFRVGDYVTAVYLPGRLEKSLRLYAFLELQPGASLRRRMAAAASPVQVAVGLLALIAIFVVLFANLYAFGRYEPLDFDYREGAVPMALGALLIGGAAGYGLLRQHRGEQRRTAERNQRAAAGEAVELEAPFLGSGLHGWLMRIILLLGLPLIGGLIALCWAFMANAWLDTSTAREQPVRIEEMTMTTHAFLFREYQLGYVMEGSEEVRELLTTPQHLMSFQDERGVARIRAGRFGWPWIESVDPVLTARKGEPEQASQP